MRSEPEGPVRKRLARWWRGWSLRARLLAGLLALMAAVSLIIGGVTVAALNHFQLRQVDAQLTKAIPPDQNGGPHDGDPYGGRGGPTFLHLPGQSVGTLGAQVSGGTVVGASVLRSPGSNSRTQDVPASDYPTLLGLPVDGKAHSRHLDGLGDYRLTAHRTPGDDVIINGLPLSSAQDTLYSMMIVVGGVTLTGLAVAGLAGALIIRLTLRPLRRVAQTAGRVAELPLDRGEVALGVRVPAADTDPRTEVGQVGAALNRMLGHVAAALAARHASETRVRQFVADASHELRTPLAAIRGYAELTRRAQTEPPADVAHALRRVESETARMTTLVEDLLLLAQLDSGRPLARDRVDVSRLVVDAVSDASAAGPDHRWRLDLPPEPLSVTGDAARLHQVLANLLANARTHAPPGTTVTTSLAGARAGAGAGGNGGRGQVALRVTDDGPGIPPTLLPEIFERFSRGDASRSRATGSTGLGLAIVAAVVEAHEGTVEVDSTPGRTEFTVLLPAGGAGKAVAPADS
jgi:two-component system, OmpR family, sensor kinase